MQKQILKIMSTYIQNKKMLWIIINFQIFLEIYDWIELLLIYIKSNYKKRKKILIYERYNSQILFTVFLFIS